MFRPPLDPTRLVWVSAATGDGLELLRQVLGERLQAARRHYRFLLEPAQGALRAELYQLGAVLSDQSDDLGRSLLEVELDPRDHARLQKRHAGLAAAEEAGAAG